MLALLDIFTFFDSEDFGLDIFVFFDSEDFGLDTFVFFDSEDFGLEDFFFCLGPDLVFRFFTLSSGGGGAGRTGILLARLGLAEGGGGGEDVGVGGAVEGCDGHGVVGNEGGGLIVH